MHGNCKCFHHICAKILAGLGWLSAIAFWWASWNETIVWGFDSSDWFAQILVFVILAFSTKFCGCCWRHYGMTGKMAENCDCKCPACEGKDDQHVHENGHKHM